MVQYDTSELNWRLLSKLCSPFQIKGKRKLGQVVGKLPAESLLRCACTYSPEPTGALHIEVCVRRRNMPRKIVDFSVLSEIIREEPFYLHFWESTPKEALQFLKDPRKQLNRMGIRLPGDCRVETTIENHDWLSANSKGLAADNGTIICGTGGGNIAKNYYKVSLYAHRDEDIGRFKKTLLSNSPEEQKRSRRKN
jgi:hypothetical protein